MDANRQVIAELEGINSLDDLQAKVGRHHLIPGWIPTPNPPLWKEMRSEFGPAHWRYLEARAAMQSAGRLIGTDRAERRNLIMVNPKPGNKTTLRTLVGAYQSILPGERARSHRHAPHALRVILESTGSYSTVNGHKHPMDTGDIVLTPGWHWHGHGHDGADQAYWFDGLDVPLTHLLEPMFYEDHPQGFEPITETSPHSPMRFAWASVRKGLDDASADAADHFGKTLDLAAPSMPTITLKVHSWPAGYRSRPYRHTANTIFVVMQGSGSTTLGEETVKWDFGDALAVPGWTRIEHHIDEASVVFSMSDENLMRWSKYYRFEELS